MKDSIRMFTRPFYYLRHGETDSNARKLVAGSLDVELTSLGHQQAITAAYVLADEPITAIYSSPLRRARDTAEPIARVLDLPINIVAELAERNWGALEGKPRGSRVRGVTPDGAEPTQEFIRRVLTGFAQIDADVPLIVGHSGVYRVLCRTLQITQTEGPIMNALPLRFELLPQGGWRISGIDE